MQTINNVVRINHFKAGVDRSQFECMEINIPSNSEFIRRAFAYAHGIEKHLNKGQANTSEERASDVLKIDNFSGIIAELACKEVLDWKYGKDKFYKPDSSTSKNQIDISLYNGKSIEVRSSCVRNGLDFALFYKKNNTQSEQFFDVIGPYSNGYKSGEIIKDYYMRVLYECDKKDFMTLFAKPYLKLYITGGATRKMMEDESIYQIKHLTPAGGQVQEESDYRVIPLAKSLDINEFFRILERENNI